MVYRTLSLWMMLVLSPASAWMDEPQNGKKIAIHRLADRKKRNTERQERVKKRGNGNDVKKVND